MLAAQTCKYRELVRKARDNFQRQRAEQFTSLIPLALRRSTIDVGGTPQFWNRLKDPGQLTLVNCDPLELKDSERYAALIGDGRHLDFPTGAFDLAFLNSVIEHVGDYDDMQMFANELRRVGKSYYCQTPNKWFPVEPHLGMLFLHWFPSLLNHYWVVRYLSLWGLLNKPDRETAARSIANIKLITRRQLQKFFPDSVIIVERYFGIAKSYLAVRIASAAPAAR
jgi:hypothetical protein